MSTASLVYGLHAVRAVLERRPGDVLRLALAAARDDARMRGLRELAAARGIGVSHSSTEALDRETGGAAHQGVLAEVRPSAALNENRLLDLLVAASPPLLVLVLDGVSDPHNLGACLRTADAAGANAVVAPRDRAAGLTPVVRKVAAGAAETVPFAQVTNLARSLRDLKAAGLWIAGTAEDGEQELYRADLTGSLAVVMGAEGRGLRRLTRESCDYCMRLPMRGTVASLNVSVAAGIVLFEARRQQAAQLAKPEQVR
ncbi:MAG TPA: 23S rRNA (guanosine(2251)-2'-O)-methyltransferase RlmB [Steroidobacteraceae bacterium]|nr:23S rRNA (guanosine(2251)-2'-O)-methyltransferase RlmB [Steroidobacteraceae bacterium]